MELVIACTWIQSSRHRRSPACGRLSAMEHLVLIAVEKKKAEPVGMDNEKKREKSQRTVSRLEKDLKEASKEIQALGMSTKLITAVVVMMVMLGVNKR